MAGVNDGSHRALIIRSCCMTPKKHAVVCENKSATSAEMSDRVELQWIQRTQ